MSWLTHFKLPKIEIVPQREFPPTGRYALERATLTEMEAELDVAYAKGKKPTKVVARTQAELALKMAAEKKTAFTRLATYKQAREALQRIRSDIQAREESARAAAKRMPKYRLVIR